MSWVARACSSAVTPATPERSSGLAGSYGRGQLLSAGVVSWTCTVSPVLTPVLTTVVPSVEMAMVVSVLAPSPAPLPSAVDESAEAIELVDHMAGTAMSTTAKAGTARRMRGPSRHPTSSAPRAAPAAAAPSVAQAASAK